MSLDFAVREEIRTQLLRKGLTQNALTRVWGVSPGSVSRILHGKQKITLEQVMQAADFLRMETHELLYLAKVSEHYMSQMNKRRK